MLLLVIVCRCAKRLRSFCLQFVFICPNNDTNFFSFHSTFIIADVFSRRWYYIEFSALFRFFDYFFVLFLLFAVNVSHIVLDARVIIWACVLCYIILLLSLFYRFFFFASINLFVIDPPEFFFPACRRWLDLQRDCARQGLWFLCVISTTKDRHKTITNVDIYIFDLFLCFGRWSR